MDVVGQQDFQSLVLSCNKDGMDALRKGQHKAAFEQFKYAEAILIANQAEGDTTSLQAVTCNNLGCYYKKVGKLHGALSYLRRALKMEVVLKTHEVTLAGTHLNICAILSKLDKHDKAVQHAISALDLIDQLVNRTEPEKVTHDDYSVLAIAYHNVAVEREHLKQYEKAASAFQQGYQVAKRCFGEDHPLSLTLGNNCDAVLKKTQKLSKFAATSTLGGSRAYMKDGASDMDNRIGLPEIQTTRGDGSEQLMPQLSPAHKEAREWAQDEQAWRQFAQAAVSGEVSRYTPESKRFTPEGYPPLCSSPSPRSETPLRDAELRSIVTPSFKDTINYRDGKPSDTTLSPSERMHRTPMEKAMDDHPEAMMDIIEAESKTHALGTSRTAANDYRPNRVIKGTTRTSRVVRRTGLFQSSKHRDMILTNRTQGKGDLQKSEYVKKVAAEKIQRVWRAWYRYCEDNSEWMTTTWLCATMIQARWRSYHVRRMKFDRAAGAIQRHIRGFLVRKTMMHHRAAVVIQRHIVGILTRAQLLRLHKSAVKVQSLIRGGQARRKVKERRIFLNKTVLTMQCGVRCFLARRKVQAKRAVVQHERRKVKAAADIQRCWRGKKGRQRAEMMREKYGESLEKHRAATKLQAMARRDQACRRVDNVRAERLSKMNAAATFLRKMWLGARTRKRYKGLVDEFRAHEQHIVTIQRYGRGFLVRLRMWREAIRAEEELWAALEIQRVWRGYKGRIRWEAAYERVYSREIAALKMQCLVRGWLARTKVARTKRKIARSEFERARRRFKAAQKIQAMARRVAASKRVSEKRRRVLGAAICIQRIARGHALRIRLWNQVIGMRATMVTAVVRGFLVRNRRFHLCAKVIFIQRMVRKWQRLPKEFRADAFAKMKERKAQAAKIQDAYRKHSEKKEITQIQQADFVAPALT